MKNGVVVLDTVFEEQAKCVKCSVTLRINIELDAVELDMAGPSVVALMLGGKEV